MNLNISKERVRTYHYPDNSTVVVRNPKKLVVTLTKEGDVHRITTKDGYGYYIKPGWNAISWDGPVIF